MTPPRSTTERSWECPCGAEPPKRLRDATPVRTLNSLREPRCVFCGRRYQTEYERRSREVAARSEPRTG
jgi:hypothetical protein